MVHILESEAARVNVHPRAYAFSMVGNDRYRSDPSAHLPLQRWEVWRRRAGADRSVAKKLPIALEHGDREQSIVELRIHPEILEDHLGGSTPNPVVDGQSGR